MAVAKGELQLTAPIIFVSAYGNENRLYPLARKLWELHADMSAEVGQFYFCYADASLEPGQTVVRGKDLAIGPPTDLAQAISEDKGRFELTGQWSALENRLILDRTLRLYEYVLRSNPGPFWLFNSTITSIINFRRLAKLIADWPCQKTFAGSLEFAQLPEGKLLSFPSGSGSLLSRDMVELIVDRVNQVPPELLIDVWLGVALADQARTPLFRHDVTDPPSQDDAYFATQQAKIHAVVRAGHFHIRVKTSGNSSLAPDRYKTDIKLLMQAMQAFNTISEGDESTRGEWLRQCGRYCAPDSTTVPAVVDAPR